MSIIELAETVVADDEQTINDVRWSFQLRIQSAQRRGSVDAWPTGTIPLQHRNYLADRSPGCDMQAYLCANTSPREGASMSRAEIGRGHIGDTLTCFLVLLERHPVRPCSFGSLQFQYGSPLSRR